MNSLVPLHTLYENKHGIAYSEQTQRSDESEELEGAEGPEESWTDDGVVAIPTIGVDVGQHGHLEDDVDDGENEDEEVEEVPLAFEVIQTKSN